MKLLDVVTSPWAIEPQKLLEIKNIYETHLRGDKIDIKGLESRLGGELANKPQGYEVVGGQAIIPIQGVIAKKMNMFHQISGGVSSQLLERDVKEALEDEDVEGLILDIDSPGGTVDGTADIASVIYNARGTKPIVALANGTMASAAYWIGSAADKVYIANGTTSVGSIGVVVTHIDRSEQLKKEGVKVTEITAGKYKRVGSDTKPLSKEDKGLMEDQLNYLYSIFVETVAKHRGVDVETVLGDMADGRIFIGQQAVDAGLVDGAVTLQQLISGDVESKESVITLSKTNERIEKMSEITLETLKESYPDIVKALFDEGVDSVEDPSIVDAKARDSERERIQSVLDLEIPGHEELIQSLAFDGKTTAAEAAIQVLKAEKASVSLSVEKIEEDGAELHVEESVVAPKAEKKEGWDDPAVQEEFAGDKEAYEAYTAAMNMGLVKIHRGNKK